MPSWESRRRWLLVPSCLHVTSAGLFSLQRCQPVAVLTPFIKPSLQTEAKYQSAPCSLRSSHCQNVVRQLGVYFRHSFSSPVLYTSNPDFSTVDAAGNASCLKRYLVFPHCSHVEHVMCLNIAGNMTGLPQTPPHQLQIKIPTDRYSNKFQHDHLTPSACFITANRLIGYAIRG